MDIKENVKNYINHKYDMFGKGVRHTWINRITKKATDAFDPDKYIKKNMKNEAKKAASNYVYDSVINGLKREIRADEPKISKVKLRRVASFALGKALDDRKHGEWIYCDGHDSMGLMMNSERKWFWHTATRQDSVQYLNVIADDGLKNYRLHKKHVHWAEYIAIPAVIFTLPEAASMAISFVTGAVFKAVAAGVMLYGSHFVTLNAVPRLILSAIGDGIMYYVNRKRDEE